MFKQSLPRCLDNKRRRIRTLFRLEFQVRVVSRYGNDLIPLHDPTDLLDWSRRILCNALFGKYYLGGFSKRGYEYALQDSTLHTELGSKMSIPPSRLHAITPSSHRTPLHLFLSRLVRTPTPYLPLLPICIVSLLLLIRMRLLIKPSSCTSTLLYGVIVILSFIFKSRME